jgi:hypothetical protein
VLSSIHHVGECTCSLLVASFIRRGHSFIQFYYTTLLRDELVDYLGSRGSQKRGEVYIERGRAGERQSRGICLKLDLPSGEFIIYKARVFSFSHTHSNILSSNGRITLSTSVRQCYTRQTIQHLWYKNQVPYLSVTRCQPILVQCNVSYNNLALSGNSQAAWHDRKDSPLRLTHIF